MGRTRRLLSLTWRLRSWQDSHARRRPRFLRYLRPPWMSLELRPEVAEAKSFASTRPTRIPRSAASRKMDAPVIPPPTTRRSSGSPWSFRKSSGRARLLNESSPTLQRLPHARRGDEHVVDPIPTGLHVRAQPIEPAVVHEHPVDLGLVVAGSVANIPARVRVDVRGEGVGNENAVLAQVCPDPAQVVERLGLGQPGREADEQGNIVWRPLFEPPAHRVVRHVSAQELEPYSEFLRSEEHTS